MTFPFGETVDVLTAQTTTDPYSTTTVLNWTATPTEVSVDGVAVEPRPSTEPLRDARNAVVSGFTLYLPPGTVISPTNRVRVRGSVYQVLGEAAAWRHPFTGWEPGVIVQCERVEG